MISSTVCLNSGLDDIMNKRCPADVNVLYRGNSYEDLEKMREKLLGKIENQVSYEKINTECFFIYACGKRRWELKICKC